MVEIVKIDFHFVRPNDVVIVPFRVGLLREQLLFVTVFDAGGTRDAWTKLQDTTVVALKLVGITRHIGTRPHETHLSNKDIDKLGETIHLAVAQPMANTGDTQVAGNGNRVTFRLVGHSAELADTERLAVFTDACLHEKDRAIRVQFDEYGNDEQGKKQHNKSNKSHDTIEAPFAEKPYFVFIFLHVAWPPC